MAWILQRWKPPGGDNAQIMRQLNIITKQLTTIEKHLMTQDELIAKLQSDTAQIVKIGTETRTLLDKIKELLDMLANQTLKPEVEQAVADLEAQVAVVDDLVPDAPPPAP